MRSAKKSPPAAIKVICGLIIAVHVHGIISFVRDSLSVERFKLFSFLQKTPSTYEIRKVVTITLDVGHWPRIRTTSMQRTYHVYIFTISILSSIKSYFFQVWLFRAISQSKFRLRQKRHVDFSRVTLTL